MVVQIATLQAKVQELEAENKKLKEDAPRISGSKSR
jgi:cell division protein FtsB